MEIHRLKEMGNYDPQVFNEIFYKVQPLIKKLVRDISPRAMGYPPDIIESWFHDKMIFVFNKYATDDPELIKGKVISSLQKFKYRVLKKAYQERVENNVISVGEDNELENFIADPTEESTQEIMLGLIYEFMRKNLTQEAFEIFQVEQNPPEYIKVRTKSRVSGRLIAEYLGYPATSTSIKYINLLRDEVRDKILEARSYFSDNYQLV